MNVRDAVRVDRVRGRRSHYSQALVRVTGGAA